MVVARLLIRLIGWGLAFGRLRKSGAGGARQCSHQDGPDGDFIQCVHR
jgi:hypothetical protein